MNIESFKTTIKTTENVLFVIDFTAKWCGPCKRISPLIDELEKKKLKFMFRQKL